MAGFFKWARLGCLAFFACGFADTEEKRMSVPFPKALDGPTDDGLIIGNGDINALLWTEQGAVFLRLTENDVWDARRRRPFRGLRQTKTGS